MFPALATFRPVEHDPRREIIAELLEAVRDARRHEQEFTGPECRARIAADEFTGACNDHVHLVARVRLLRIVAARRIELDAQRAVRGELDKTLAVRCGQLRQSLREIEREAAVELLHPDAPPK